MLFLSKDSFLDYLCVDYASGMTTLSQEQFLETCTELDIEPYKIIEQFYDIVGRNDYSIEYMEKYDYLY